MDHDHKVEVGMTEDKADISTRLMRYVKEGGDRVHSFTSSVITKQLLEPFIVVSITILKHRQQSSGKL